MAGEQQATESPPATPPPAKGPLQRLEDFWRSSIAGTTAAALLLTLLSFLVPYLYGGVVPDPDEVRLQLAGSAGAAIRVLGGQASEEAVANARRSLSADSLLIPLYVAATCVAATIGSALFLSRRARLLAVATIPGVILAAVCDVAENMLLGAGLGRIGDPPAADTFFRFAAIAATFKFCLLAVLLPVAAFAVVTVLKRSIARLSTNKGPAGRANEVLLPWRTVDDEGRSWPEYPSSTAPVLGASPEAAGKARQVYGGLVPRDRAAKPPTRPDCAVGFCVSGGGIRSACFTLGILQVLRQKLLQARYLVSVSGGGYLAGALQLALTPEKAPTAEAGSEQATVSPDDVYAEGSMEEDHTRRHGDYLADGAAQWLVALWTVLRGVLGSVVVITASAVTLGLILAYFYDFVPLIDRSPLLSVFDGSESRTAYPAPLVPVEPAFPLVLAVAALLWLLSLRLLFTPHQRAAKALRVISGGMLVASAIAALFVYVIPAVMWAATIPASEALQASDELSTAERVGTGAGGTLLLTYLGSLVAIIGRGGKMAGGLIGRIKGLFGGAAGGDGKPKGPGGLVQRLVVWAVLLLVAGLNLLALGIAAISGVEWDRWVKVAIPGTLALVWWAVDQTWMSLHPFYRKRLAGTFSVRRVRLAGGDVAARPYHFEAEDTPLARYGAPVDGFPQVIFACAANLSGPDRTAPGRRAVSYTLSYDYIGGADVGWIPTDLAWETLSGPLRADLTVQAAMAISGAAFASAMGTQSQAYQRILALSNARLGSWLPNPAYFYSLAQDEPEWWMPQFPRIRRLTYFFREIAGSHPEDNRLLMLSDGGHYDNLGLIELLRHRCRTVYCIDSGGDPPPFPQSLAEAITQARAELGVKVWFEQEDINALLVGSGRLEDFPKAIEPILPRLSAKAVAVGVIEYPEPFRLETEEQESRFGVIVFAKSLITPAMSADLFAYSAAKPAFPRDPTGDQWFTGTQFNAYQALGHDVGRQVLEAVQVRVPQVWNAIEQRLDPLAPAPQAGATS